MEIWAHLTHLILQLETLCSQHPALICRGKKKINFFCYLAEPHLKKKKASTCVKNISLEARVDMFLLFICPEVESSNRNLVLGSVGPAVHITGEIIISYAFDLCFFSGVHYDRHNEKIIPGILLFLQG